MKNLIVFDLDGALAESKASLDAEMAMLPTCGTKFYRFDVYYGMADYRIGVARLIVPDPLPSGAPADGEGPKAGGP